MYQTRISGDRLYHAQSQGYGQPVETFGRTEEGETPMSLVNIALASCVTMCVQGYFAKKWGQAQLPIRLTSDYEAERFSLKLILDFPLDGASEKELLDYVEEHCRVKALLKETIAFDLVVDRSS